MPVKLSGYLEKRLHKKCRVCQKMKPLTDYYKAVLAADSRRGECKKCASIYSATGEYPIAPR